MPFVMVCSDSVEMLGMILPNSGSMNLKTGNSRGGNAEDGRRQNAPKKKLSHDRDREEVQQVKQKR